MTGQDAALSVISEMSERLSPFTEPSVEIHTSTFDVGDASSTSMVFGPGFRVVGLVSAVVSSSVDGVAVDEDRICTAVPVLLTLMVTDPTVTSRYRRCPSA